MKLHSIHAGNFKLDGGAMFGVVPKVIWNKINPADENNLCSWAMRCLLIEDGNRLILVDNGIGDKQDEKFMGHYHLHGPHTLDIQESGQLKFIEKSPEDFPANFVVRQAFGHTEAMMLPQLVYKNQTLLYMADLLPSAGHIPLPYVMAYDMFPLTTLNEKKSFLTEAQQNNYILFFEHDAVNECCTLKMTEKGIRMDQSFKLEEI